MAENPLEKFLTYRDGEPDEAKFFWSGGPVEVAERTWFQSMLSGCVGFETDSGLVLIDSGTEALSPGLAELLRRRTQATRRRRSDTLGSGQRAYARWLRSVRAACVRGTVAPS